MVCGGGGGCGRLGSGSGDCGACGRAGFSPGLVVEQHG